MLNQLNRCTTYCVCLAALAIIGCSGEGDGEGDGDAASASTQPTDQSMAPVDNASRTIQNVRQSGPDTSGLSNRKVTPGDLLSSRKRAGQPNAGSYIVKVEPQELYLGEVGSGIQATGTVKLVNTGAEPMKILDCRKTCSCTTTNCPKNTVLAPGESVEVEVSLKTAKATGRRTTKVLNFVVEGQPDLRLPVSVDVVNMVEAEPVLLDPEVHRDGRLVLRSRDEEPFRILSMKPQILTDFDLQSSIEHVLYIDFDRWRELNSRPTLTFTIDHPSAKLAYAKIQVPRRAAGNSRIASRPRSTMNAGVAVAIQRGDVDGLTKILDAGNSPETYDQVGRTMVGVAAFYGRVAILEFLLDREAEVDSTDTLGRTPLMAAVQSRRSNLESITTLIKHGADLDATDEALGATPLIWAAGRSAAPGVIDLLLASGADANATDKTGMTALMWAARFGDAERVQALVQGGASVMATDSNNWTCIDYAKKRSDGAGPEIAALLEATVAADSGSADASSE